MAISDAIIKMVKYSPELIPDSWVGAVPLSAEVPVPILDLRRFKSFIATLTNIQLTANASVTLRASYDDVRVDENTAAMFSARIGDWSLSAINRLYYNFFGVAAVATYTTHYGVWGQKPTVAHKLQRKMPLTSEDQEISKELGIANSVEKGILPLPIAEQIAREYHVAGEETHARVANIAVAGTVYLLETIYPRADEFLVLTKIAAAPAAAINAVHFVVDRDDDIGFGDVLTFPLALTVGGEIDCFIPAMKEIRLSVISAGVAPGAGQLFRYTFRRVRLTNTLRARFGLVTKDEIPGDTWNKVLGGVL